MNTLCNSVFAFPSCELVSSSPKREVVAALAITTLVVGILGTLYSLLGLTPISSQIPFLHSLTVLNTIEIALIIVGCATVSGVAVAVLIGLKRQSRPEPCFIPSKSLSKVFDSEIWQALQANRSLPKEHIQGIKMFLRGSKFSTHHDFYYHLAKMGEYFCTNFARGDQERLAWISFLDLIDGQEMTIDSWYDKFKIHISCFWEFQKCIGNQCKIQIKPFVSDNYEQVDQICREAFLTWDHTRKGIPYFSCEKRHSLVVWVKAEGELEQDQEPKSIAGIIVLEEIDHSDGLKSLFIHTLARKASLVKMGITEEIRKYVQKNINIKDYKSIFCHVRKNNVVAQRLYRAIGFQQSGFLPDGDWEMTLTDPP